MTTVSTTSPACLPSILTYSLPVRERIQNLRSSLGSRRRTLAIASSTFLHNHASLSTPSTSASPPHAPISTSPQAIRSATHRASFSNSSASSTPPPSSSSPVPRPLSSASRPPLNTNFFTSSSPQAVRSPLSVATTPPQSYSRPSYLSGPPSHPYATPHGRSVSAGSAPYGTPIPTRGVDPLARQIEELQAQMIALSDAIARARSGLIQELVEVFSVVEVGGRPPLGGKAGTKGEWTIGGLVLPVPGDIRREYHWLRTYDDTRPVHLRTCRISARPYQRGPVAYDTLRDAARVLSRDQAAVRDCMESLLNAAT